MMARRIRRGFTLVEVTTVIFVVAILASLILPSLQAARSASRRDQCLNNLKQIGIGLHNYHDTHKCFPPGWVNYTPDAGDRPRLGWQTLLLPFVEQGTIYQKLYPDMIARQVRKSTIVETGIPLFRCPSDMTPATNPLRGGFGTSNYSGNFGTVAPPRWLTGGMNSAWPGEPSTLTTTDGIFWSNSRVRFRDCRDGLSNIISAGEKCFAGGAGIWMGVRGNEFENDVVTDFSVGNEMNSGPGSFSSRHESGANFLLGDGSVRFISDLVASGTSQGPGLYQDLSSRSDGRTLGEF
ncbi:MAG: DUF1559 domain-containing protein [Planctomycetota bacterium]|nr:DUF1559 domain-containing protein [Planctomycetota bacterium]MDA1250563.1 DUF1559 domain-containing protein [Planctomycetota bacterium]